MSGAGSDPEQEAVLADSVGVALLIVLDRLTPAERLAFVLHGLFDVSFDEIGRIVGRTATAARQLASRARRRVQGGTQIRHGVLSEQRKVIDSFLTALRGGDFEGLMAVLDPDLVVRVDEFAARPGAPREIRGAQTWAKSALAFTQAIRPAEVEPLMVNGAVGLLWAPGGRLKRVLSLTIERGKIVRIEVIGDPAWLQEAELGVLE